MDFEDHKMAIAEGAQGDAYQTQKGNANVMSVKHNIDDEANSRQHTDGDDRYRDGNTERKKRPVTQAQAT